jgi:Lsr2
MVRQVVVTLVDDLDGGSGAETVRFALDGHDYEIDLTERNAARLRDDLQRFTKAGRRVGGKANGGRPPSGRSDDRGRNAQIRAWAAGQNIIVAPQGRIPAGVRAAYDAGHTQ